MKHLFVFLLLYLCAFSLSAQVTRRDTTFSLDTIRKGDTIFIYKVRHITVVIDVNTFSNRIDTLKLSNFTPPKYDFIRYNFIAESYHHQKTKYKLNINNFSPIIDVGKFKLLSDNDIIDTSRTPYFYSGYGFLLNFNKLNVFYTTGIKLTNYYENYNLVKNRQIVDTNYYQKVIPSTFWLVDTVWFLNLDSLIIGDTVWVPYIDSNFNVVYDTTNIASYDTSEFNNRYEKINSISYIEFPLIIGWQKRIKNWQFSPQIGLITGVLYYSNYRIAADDDGFLLPKIAKINYYAFGALYLSYSLTESYSIFLNTWAKYPLNYNYSLNNTKYKYFTYGVSLGFSLNF
ncbi:MAG: hypothetical protein JXR68_07465 [Bacteroidales bacterium]|nr:hypothetical protein [Bacteroidales bacterium]